MAKTETKPAAKRGSTMERLLARTAPVTVQDGGEIEIPLSKIQFDSTQPRSAFHHPDGQVDPRDEKKVQEMADSIKEQGQLQPIIVRPGADGTYIVVVGERRTRAHLLLGKTTIRAVVRSDLNEASSKRLIVQLVENIVRDELPDHDVARSVKQLLQGTESEPAMSQSQIAAALSKSEGWVSRYVRFGDEELQRLWVKPGIVDTVEHLYRVSVLPEPLKVEILRRVNLDPEHPDFVVRPLLRSFLDEMARQAKIAKAGGSLGASGRGPAAPAAPSSSSSSSESAGGPTGGASDHQADESNASAPDAMTKALTEAAAAGQGTQTQAAAAPETDTSIHGTAYSLPEHLRASILAGAGVTTDDSQRSGTAPPVNIRGPLKALLELVAQLDKDDAKSAKASLATITLPAPLAQAIANKVAGMVVEPRAVSATIQRHLSEG